jgi:hypothetical protein
VPCIDVSKEDLTLRALDGYTPAICSGATCLMQDRTGTDILVDAPTTPDPALLPLAATLRTDRPAACLGDHCRPLGRKLAAAVAAEAAHDEPSLQATRDLSTAVVGTRMWSIARDRPIPLARPYYRPNEDIIQMTAVGDLVVVRWGGDCTDARCHIAHLVDARGGERGEVDVDGGLLRLDDHAFVTISPFSRLTVYDLHTGALITEHDPALSSGGFEAAARLPTPKGQGERLAVLRRVDNGALLEVLTLWFGQLHSDSQHVFADCE